MNIEGAKQRCNAVRAAYTESLQAGQLAETRLWADVIKSAGWDADTDPIMKIVEACERELAAATGRVSSLLDRTVFA